MSKRKKKKKSKGRHIKKLSRSNSTSSMESIGSPTDNEEKLT